MTSPTAHLTWLLLPLLVLADMPKTDVPLDFKHDLQHVFMTLKHVLLEAKPSKAVYGEILTTLNNLKKREEFYVTIRSYHSTKFLWEKVSFLNSILRKKIYEPYSAYYSPIYWTVQETTPILVQILQTLPRAMSEKKFSYDDRMALLGAVNAYKLFNKARKLVDKKLTEAEKELFTAIQRLITLGFHHMASDPILAPLTIPDEPAPKDAEVDAGHEFTEVAVDRFLLRLTKPEKDLIAVIGGISVVSLDNRCMVFTKNGKWYLHSYPCR